MYEDSYSNIHITLTYTTVDHCLENISVKTNKQTYLFRKKKIHTNKHKRNLKLIS